MASEAFDRLDHRLLLGRFCIPFERNGILNRTEFFNPKLVSNNVPEKGVLQTVEWQVRSAIVGR